MEFREVKFCGSISNVAEYIVASSAAQEMQCLLTLYQDLDIEQTLPIVIYEDHISCIKLSEKC